MGEIKENQKVKLSFITAGGYKQEIDCLIKEVFSDRISLDFPDEILDFAESLEEGSELMVKVFTPSGVKVFDSIVLYSPLEHDFVIEYAEIEKEIQRREYTRVLLETKVVIQRRAGKGNIVTNTVDVSGGGIKFYYDGGFEPEEEVNVALFLPQSKAVQARGIIIYNQKLAATEHVLYFTDIDESDRDRIVKVCFDIQTGRTPEIEENDEL